MAFKHPIPAVGSTFYRYTPVKGNYQIEKIRKVKNMYYCYARLIGNPGDHGINSEQSNKYRVPLSIIKELTKFYGFTPYEMDRVMGLFPGTWKLILAGSRAKHIIACKDEVYQIGSQSHMLNKLQGWLEIYKTTGYLNPKPELVAKVKRTIKKIRDYELYHAMRKFNNYS